ncbi:hypothetical protein LTR95_003828 [Oleoguttula sp. CCFEE 5521]
MYTSSDTLAGKTSTAYWHTTSTTAPASQRTTTTRSQTQTFASLPNLSSGSVAVKLSTQSCLIWKRHIFLLYVYPCFGLSKALALSAATRVFIIPELVEEILFHVRMKDVLVLQRTSKAFDRTIRESPRLQEKLFFRPIKLAAPRQRGLLLDMASDSYVNNLLLSFLDAQCGRYRCKLGRNAANIEGITMGYDFFLHYRRP